MRAGTAAALFGRVATKEKSCKMKKFLILALAIFTIGAVSACAFDDSSNSSMQSSSKQESSMQTSTEKDSTEKDSSQKDSSTQVDGWTGFY